MMIIPNIIYFFNITDFENFIYFLILYIFSSACVFGLGCYFFSIVVKFLKCRLIMFTARNCIIFPIYYFYIIVKNYRIVIMVRVNPSYIREPTTMKGYWIVDGNSNQLRPYRLLIKEFGNVY